jgi:hypothetical protein
MGIALCAVCVWPQLREPRWGGRSLSAWAKQLAEWPLDGRVLDLRGKSATTARDQAVQAVQMIGKDALKPALKWCRAADSRFVDRARSAESWVNTRQKLVIDLPLPERYGRKARGYEVLRALAPVCSDVLSNACLLLEEGDPVGAEHFAPAVFQSVGVSSIPSLQNLLRCGNDHTKIGAAVALASFGPAASQALGSLIPLLSHQNGQVRYWAAFALSQISQDCQVLVPILADFLERNPGNAPGALFEVLARCGPEAVAAVGPLKRCVTLSLNRARALHALRCIVPDDKILSVQSHENHSD